MPDVRNFTVESGLPPPRKLNMPTNVLNTADIDGATNRGPRREIKRPDGWEVDRSRSTRLIPERVTRRNDMSLNVSDIEHTSASTRVTMNMNLSNGTQRSCNPLTPVYNTATYSVRPYTPPRQLAQTNVVHDIAGTAPTPHYTSPVRETMKTRDIERAAPRSKIGTRTPGLALVTEDIVKQNPGNTGFRTSRTTNPLSPRYRIANPPKGEAHYLSMNGEDHPKTLHRARHNAASDLSLTTHDIPGSTATTAMPFPKERRQVRNPCDVSDMPFASPCKRQTVMRPSGRATNPVAPIYQPLDHKSYLPPMEMKRNTQMA